MAKFLYQCGEQQRKSYSHWGEERPPHGCLAKFPKPWTGRCPNCGGYFNIGRVLADDPEGEGMEAEIAEGEVISVKDRMEQLQKAGPKVEYERIEVGVPILDKVLDGGLLPGTLIALYGDPGCGKSTLSFKALQQLAKRRETTLYITGEESVDQLLIRYNKFGKIPAKFLAARETDQDAIFEIIEENDVKIVAIDSIQTIEVSDEWAPGSDQSVKYAIKGFMDFAKKNRITIIVIGHINKSGAIKGTTALSHYVDVVLHIAKKENEEIRTLSCIKNRFSHTTSHSRFYLTGYGPVEIENEDTTEEEVAAMVVASNKNEKEEDKKKKEKSQNETLPETKETKKVENKENPPGQGKVIKLKTEKSNKKVKGKKIDEISKEVKPNEKAKVEKTSFNNKPILKAVPDDKKNKQKSSATKAAIQSDVFCQGEDCEKPATCFGRYEDDGADGNSTFSCDDCCDHSQIDGHCEIIKQSNDVKNKKKEKHHNNDPKPDVVFDKKPPSANDEWHSEDGISATEVLAIVCKEKGCHGKDGQACTASNGARGTGLHTSRVDLAREARKNLAKDKEISYNKEKDVNKKKSKKDGKSKNNNDHGG